MTDFKPAETRMTDDDTTRAQQLLAEHRASIDRLDAILVYTLAERFKQTQAVGRHPLGFANLLDTSGRQL